MQVPSRVKRVQSPVLSFHCDRTRSSRNSLCFPYPKTLDLTQNFLGLWVRRPPESNRFTRNVLLVSHGVTYPPSPEAQHRSHSTTEVPGNTMERDGTLWSPDGTRCHAMSRDVRRTMAHVHRSLPSQWKARWPYLLWKESASVSGWATTFTVWTRGGCCGICTFTSIHNSRVIISYQAPWPWFSYNFSIELEQNLALSSETLRFHPCSSITYANNCKHSGIRPFLAVKGSLWNTLSGITLEHSHFASL